MSNFSTNKKYKQQRVIKYTILGAAILLILFFYFGSLVGLYSLIKKHCNDYIFVSQVKLQGIRSSTLAEMRQNDLQLVATDVYASAKSISDIVTYYDDPDVVPDDYNYYYASYAENSWTYTL